ncbi:MAG: hypothetical protein SFU91_06020 [Chloroherpetonaceae bacterium]|nr:hypothetical protein [Chloroherpetonaceae bacterium]
MKNFIFNHTDFYQNKREDIFNIIIIFIFSLLYFWSGFIFTGNINVTDLGAGDDAWKIFEGKYLKENFKFYYSDHVSLKDNQPIYMIYYSLFWFIFENPTIIYYFNTYLFYIIILISIYLVCRTLDFPPIIALVIISLIFLSKGLLNAGPKSSHLSLVIIIVNFLICSNKKKLQYFIFSYLFVFSFLQFIRPELKVIFIIFLIFSLIYFFRNFNFSNIFVIIIFALSLLITSFFYLISNQSPVSRFYDAFIMQFCWNYIKWNPTINLNIWYDYEKVREINCLIFNGADSLIGAFSENPKFFIKHCLQNLSDLFIPLFTSLFLWENSKFRVIEFIFFIGLLLFPFLLIDLKKTKIRYNFDNNILVLLFIVTILLYFSINIIMYPRTHHVFFLSFLFLILFLSILELSFKFVKYEVKLILYILIFIKFIFFYYFSFGLNYPNQLTTSEIRKYFSEKKDFVVIDKANISDLLFYSVFDKNYIYFSEPSKSDSLNHLDHYFIVKSNNSQSYELKQAYKIPINKTDTLLIFKK